MAHESGLIGDMRCEALNIDYREINSSQKTNNRFYDRVQKHEFFLLILLYGKKIFFHKNQSDRIIFHRFTDCLFRNDNINRKYNSNIRKFENHTKSYIGFATFEDPGLLLCSHTIFKEINWTIVSCNQSRC